MENEIEQPHRMPTQDEVELLEQFIADSEARTRKTFWLFRPFVAIWRFFFPKREGLSACFHTRMYPGEADPDLEATLSVPIHWGPTSGKP